MLIIAIFIIGIFAIIAYNFPKLWIFLILILGFFPRLFLFTNLNEVIDNLQEIGGGFRAIDLILLGMVGAVIIKLINSVISKKNADIKNNELSLLIGIFALLILFDVVRNIPKYGISAPGEFRFRYLILIIPVYISLFLTKEKDIKNALKTVLFFSVIIPIIFSPFVIFNHRTSGNAEVFRIYGSAVNLGFLIAIIAVYLLKNKSIINIPKYFNWALLPIGIILITDTHRSVWISGVVALLLLIKYKYLKLNKMIGFAVLSLVVFYFSLSIIKDTGIKNPVAYLSERVGDIYTATEGQQNTGYWRLMVWQANIFDTYKNNLILGKGFGGYWNVYVPGFNQTIELFPHSLYVMIFVKLGLIGLLLYLMILLKVYKRFRNQYLLLEHNFKHNLYNRMLVFGIIMLIVQHIYYFMYSFSYLPLIYLGLTYSYLKVGNNKNNDLHNYPRT